MTDVVFEGNVLGREKRVTIERDTPLVDLADEVLAPIPFSCRSATCATCQVEVLEGAELLVPAAEDEVELLELIGSPSNVRLACQATVLALPGTVRVKPAGT